MFLEKRNGPPCFLFNYRFFFLSHQQTSCQSNGDESARNSFVFVHSKSLRNSRFSVVLHVVASALNNFLFYYFLLRPLPQTRYLHQLQHRFMLQFWPYWKNLHSSLIENILNGLVRNVLHPFWNYYSNDAGA